MNRFAWQATQGVGRIRRGGSGFLSVAPPETAPRMPSTVRVVKPIAQPRTGNPLHESIVH